MGGTSNTFYSVGPVVMESVSNVTATPSVQLGARVIFGGDEYVYCYNAGNSAVNQYSGVVVSGLSGFSVTVSSTSAKHHLFGHNQHATAATGTYFWAMTRGFANVKNARVSSALASSSTEPCNIYLADDGAYDWQETSGSTAVSARIYCGQAVGTGVSGGTGTSYFAAYIKGIG